MGAGYTRQSTSQIASGQQIAAAALNNEFNALAAAFSGTTGHLHDGSTGNGPVLTSTAFGIGATTTGILSASGVLGVVNPVTITGTAAQIAVANGSGASGNPTISIDPAYVGQSSITTLGTITTGTWNATVLTGQYGGTGVANTGKTITLGGNLIHAGAYTTTITSTNTTNVTLPTTGTLIGTSDVGTVATAMLANNAVTYAKMQLTAGVSVLGVAGSATTNPAAITGTANQVLAVNAAGSSLQFQNTLDNITIGGSTPAAGTFTTLTANTTVAGTGFTTYLASPPAIGATAPNTGKFTTVNATSGYQVNGTALAASNLSNGTSGSGAVVLNSGASLTTPAINGGTIDNTVIGGTTPAVGNFTVVEQNGVALVPSGAMMMWPTSTVPAGWLEANGQSTTGYPNLVAIYGSNLPDMRGVFPRGWDHGRGLDPNSPSILSYHGDQFASHSHSINDPSHNHSVHRPTVFNTAGASLGVDGPGNDTTTNTNTTGISINNTGGSETAPKYMAWMFIIKT